MSFDWSTALTPKDTRDWASSLAGNNGLSLSTLREIDLNRSGSKQDVEKYGLTTYKAKAFCWKSSDNTTDYWRPQGICGIRKNDPRLSMVAVSWYNYKKIKNPETNEDINKGVRISFVNVTPNDEERFKYRHVLLVEKDGDSNFKPVKVHAGGLGYANGFLFVPDTDKGIRVFDTTLLMKGLKEDKGKTKCGFIGDLAYAYNYRYIIPQIYYYDNLYQALKDSGLAAESGNVPKFSYLSMDWTNSTRRLMTGSYMDTDDFDNNLFPSAYLWDLSANGDGRLEINSAPRNLGIPVRYKLFFWLQGAAIFGSKLYISRSAGRGVKRHTVEGAWEDNNYSVNLTQKDIAPPDSKSILGFEDLHVSLTSDILWGLSEGNRDNKFIGDRIVFWLKDIK